MHTKKKNERKEKEKKMVLLGLLLWGISIDLIIKWTEWIDTFASDLCMILCEIQTKTHSHTHTHTLDLRTWMGIEYICDNKTVPLVHFSAWYGGKKCVESFVAVKTLRVFFSMGRMVRAWGKKRESCEVPWCWTYMAHTMC